MATSPATQCSRMYVCVREAQDLCFSFGIRYPVWLISIQKVCVFHSFELNRFYFQCAISPWHRRTTLRVLDLQVWAGHLWDPPFTWELYSRALGRSLEAHCRHCQEACRPTERRTSREQTLLPNEAAVRVLPVGRQEAADWASALDIVIKRLVTVECTVRKQAQFIS